MTLLSPWAEKLDRQNPLPEYPRMQLQRNSFFSLNGLWKYQIVQAGEQPNEKNWKDILVPFALGSKLSGTQEELRPGETLWYQKFFKYKPLHMRTMLNFEGVDQVCAVYLNGLPAGMHAGGYAPFSLDVTAMIKENNVLLVKCNDDSDQSSLAFGKQRIEHGGIWYTPSSGIWQSVWMENVPASFVQDLKITVDYDASRVYIRLAGNFTQAVINVAAGGKMISRGITNDKNYTVEMPKFHPWTPDDPFLYDLYIQTEDETIKSYFGMRKFSAARDGTGYTRFCLNNEPLFLSGLLDQGYSVDGLMTYPSDEAMQFELNKIHDMHFNLLRKHVKVECRRWYYWCDRIGILVMQDMPCGGGSYDLKYHGIRPMLGQRKIKDNQYEKTGREDLQSRKNYYYELDQMLDNLYNCVCVCSWVPFNEGWGQFDSRKVSEHIQNYDTTRLVDSASGWFDQGAGDFNSRHVYFHAFHTPMRKDDRILLLSEFGGYTYLESAHSEPKKLSGYKIFKDRIRLDEAIQKLYSQEIMPAIEKGLAGCIYTQVSDVEDECNGLFTADRRILKIDEREMKRTNERCIRSMK